MAFVRAIMCHGHVCAIEAIVFSDWPCARTEGIVEGELRVAAQAGVGEGFV